MFLLFCFIVEEEADLLPVFIIGGALCLMILFLVVWIGCKVRSAKSDEEKEHKARAEGNIT